MSDLARQIIEENLKTQNPILDLGNCGLIELPPLPEDCHWVETLILSDTWW
ncbi:MAG: hypothetical protein NZM43_12140 [Saprospiraceae bacterium]|nr:hypothetical protein [Saprospiraceae bacterium]MDW8485061.1 hypothetical protein [Saprospiraceae bacterium]